MKMKRFLCFFVCAVMLSFTYAGAALQIGTVNTGDDTNATAVKSTDGKSIDVTYSGQEDTNYVIMVVAQDGIDSETGTPTKESIDSNQNGVIAYMDQDNSKSGQVEFTVTPNLDNATKGDTYTIYMVGSGSNAAMSQIATFTADEAILFGELDGKAGFTPDDALIALKIAANPTSSEFTAEQKEAAEVDGKPGITPDDALAILKKAANPLNYKFPVE